MHPDTLRTDTATALTEHSLYTQGTEAHAAGDNETAISLFREHLSQAPEHSEAWNNLGALMYEQGDVEESIRLFGKAMVADPENSTAIENLVDAYTDAEKYTEAALLATRWSECAPDSSAPWVTLARLNLMAGHTEAARDALDRAHKASPEDERIAEALGHLGADQRCQTPGAAAPQAREGTL